MNEEDYIWCDICDNEVPEDETDGKTCESCLEREHQRQERTY